MAILTKNQRYVFENLELVTYTVNDRGRTIYRVSGRKCSVDIYAVRAKGVLKKGTGLPEFERGLTVIDGDFLRVVPEKQDA